MGYNFFCFVFVLFVIVFVVLGGGGVAVGKGWVIKAPCSVKGLYMAIWDKRKILHFYLPGSQCPLSLETLSWLWHGFN